MFYKISFNQQSHSDQLKLPIFQRKVKITKKELNDKQIQFLGNYWRNDFNDLPQFKLQTMQPEGEIQKRVLNQFEQQVRRNKMPVSKAKSHQSYYFQHINQNNEINKALTYTETLIDRQLEKRDLEILRRTNGNLNSNKQKLRTKDLISTKFEEDNCDNKQQEREQNECDQVGQMLKQMVKQNEKQKSFQLKYNGVIMFQ